MPAKPQLPWLTESDMAKMKEKINFYARQSSLLSLDSLLAVLLSQIQTYVEQKSECGRVTS